MKILFDQLVKGCFISILKDIRNRIKLHKCAECPLPQTRTCGAKAFYIHLHIHVCGGGSQSLLCTECQIIGPLSKRIPSYAGLFSGIMGFFQVQVLLMYFQACAGFLERCAGVFWGVCN